MLAALCVTEIVSWGLLYYAFPVLAPRISADTGWSSMAVTSAFSAALVVSALVGVPIGRVIDRRGPRLVMTVGSALGVLALVVIGTAWSLPVFVAGWVLAGAAMAGVLYPPAFAAITGWFDARRLGALATLTLVAGLASTVFAPLTATAGEQLGWRATYLWAAATLAVVTVPAHWLLLRRPWPARGHRDAPAADSAHAVAVLRSARFWLLTGGLTAASLAMYTGLLALVPLMLERGLDARAAAWVLGLGGVGQVAGRLVYTGLAHRASLTARTAAVFHPGDCEHAGPGRGAGPGGPADCGVDARRSRPRDRHAAAGDRDHRPLGRARLRPPLRRPRPPGPAGRCPRPVRRGRPRRGDRELREGIRRPDRPGCSRDGPDDRQRVDEGLRGAATPPAAWRS